MLIDFRDSSEIARPCRLYDRCGEEIVLPIQTINLTTGEGTYWDKDSEHVSKLDCQFDGPMRLYDANGYLVAQGAGEFDMTYYVNYAKSVSSDPTYEQFDFTTAVTLTPVD